MAKNGTKCARQLVDLIQVLSGNLIAVLRRFPLKINTGATGKPDDVFSLK
jgi:hypothetical protein